MAVCGQPLALISKAFGEVRFQTNAARIDRLYKWSIQTLTYQVPVSVLSDQALAYLLDVIPASARSYLLIVLVTHNDA